MAIYIADSGGSNLAQLLTGIEKSSNSVNVGDRLSLDQCKELYLTIPAAGKLVDSPVDLVMSQPRTIVVQDSPESVVSDRFSKVWAELGCDAAIIGVAKKSRVFGAASIVIGVEGVESSEPLTPEILQKNTPFFNVLEPLNTSGSFSNVSQDPNSSNFMRLTGGLTIAGKPWHPSRGAVLFNGEAMYLKFNPATMGFTGQSVFLRAAYPLANYIRLMVSEGAVINKAGGIIHKSQSKQTTFDRIKEKGRIAFAALLKKQIKEDSNGFVTVIDSDDSIETFPVQNIDAVMESSLKRTMEAIAAADGIPPKILMAGSYSGVFASGDPDYKQAMQFIEGFRRKLLPTFKWMDEIVMFKSWDRQFFEEVQARYPEEYGAMSYELAFSKWKRSFTAEFPSLIEEPESEKVNIEKTKLDAMQGLLQALLPNLDPTNKAALVEWVGNNLNEMTALFPNKLDIDVSALTDFMEQQAQQQQMGEEQDGETGDDDLLSSINQAIATMSQK